MPILLDSRQGQRLGAPQRAGGVADQQAVVLHSLQHEVHVTAELRSRVAESRAVPALLHGSQHHGALGP
eukprot:scaffold2269_cov221-Pinguiococcus_pyrenoidosus.AAC.8